MLIENSRRNTPCANSVDRRGERDGSTVIAATVYRTENVSAGETVIDKYFDVGTSSSRAPAKYLLKPCVEFRKYFTNDYHVWQQCLPFSDDDVIIIKARMLMNEDQGWRRL